MPDRVLDGIGVLITRATQQSDELTRAIESAGGTAWHLPALDIRPLPTSDTERARKSIPAPDIAVFVSPNAVEYGLQHAGDARLAAIGPATAAAIDAAGHIVDIAPAHGFDSEHLLQLPSLQNVADLNVLIVRGTEGRELLADTLRSRGANVFYLPVYERRCPVPKAATLQRVSAAWQAGGIHYVTAMSVATLTNLCRILPPDELEQLAATPLVTPAARVIKEFLQRFPAARVIRTDTTDADAIVNAIIANLDPAARY